MSELLTVRCVTITFNVVKDSSIKKGFTLAPFVQLGSFEGVRL